MKVENIQVTLTPHNIQLIYNALRAHEKNNGDDLGLPELVGVFGSLKQAAYEKTVY